MPGHDKDIELVDLDSLEDEMIRPVANDDATASSQPAEPGDADAETESSRGASDPETSGEDTERRAKIEIGTNRRVAVRHPLISLVDVFDHKKNRNLGRVSDLSIHGFKVVTLNAIIPGTTMTLKLVPQSQLSKDDTVLLKGICRWCHPGDGDVFRVGFEFTDVDEDKKQALVGLIHRLPG